MKRLLFLSALLTIIVIDLSAQTFGRNKPRYRSFDFEVEKSPHFDIYHYLDNENVVQNLAGMTEQWFDYHNEVLNDPFYNNPIIFYNNHADFQQTNSISGNIGVGTGGVTEAFKNRVVMPVTLSNQSTWQVLGHELVHAFQFHIILNSDSTSIRSLANLPLWIVEGMAEYMSLGRIDPFTAMWMRDAVIQDKIPTVSKLANPRYFPYRYGQAMWSYITSQYGDQIIKPLFYNTAIAGPDISIPYTLGIDTDQLSKDWASALKAQYAPYIKGKKATIGRKLLSEDNSGRINVSPTMSPNGKYVVYLSEKDLFSTDLFLANATNGKIIRKMTSLVKDTDLDNLNFLESSGAWSPNSKEFAFVAFKKGRNVLIIKDVENAKTKREIKVDGLPAMAGPTWSPDGKKIIVSGLVDGYPDLYEISVRSGKATRLTNDAYSEIMPSYSPDGSSVVFSYDKRSMMEGRTNGRYTYDLAELNLADNSITTYPIFHTADNLNPQYDHLGNIYFVSDRDGVRNLYRYAKADDKVYQMTKLNTGISGITRYSPMITVNQKKDRVLYTHYYDSGYSLYKAKGEQFLNQEVDPSDIDFTAAILPGSEAKGESIVEKNLLASDEYDVAGVDTKSDKYRPNFKLDFITGGGGVGVNNNQFGNYTGLQGGISMIFSDLLGNNQLFTQFSLNGEIKDFGGQATYINRTHRLAYGVGLSHIPLRTGYQSQEIAQLQDQNGNVFDALKRETNIIRIFDENLNLFVHYPFSTTLRLEGGVNGQFRSFRQDQYDDYFDRSGRLLLQEQNRVETGDQIRLNQFYNIEKGFGTVLNAALVGDNSYFGMTSPLAGHRFRFSVERSFGINNFTGVLADYRKYIWLRPVTLAFRSTNYMRFVNESNTLYPFFLGQMGFVRGYGSLFGDNLEEMNLNLNQLIGSKVALAGFEARLPFTGPKQLALIGTNAFLSDLILFFDAGVAFNDFDDIGNEQLGSLEPAIATSAGAALRINLFGALILEPYMAWPLRENGVREFGLNLIPGW